MKDYIPLPRVRLSRIISVRIIAAAVPVVIPHFGTLLRYQVLVTRGNLTNIGTWSTDMTS